MDVENNEHLKVLRKTQDELREFKRKVEQSAITVDDKQYVRIDMDEFEKLVQDVCVPEYLDHILKYSADKGVHYGILNMRLEKRRAQRIW